MEIKKKLNNMKHSTMAVKHSKVWNVHKYTAPYWYFTTKT